jgi:LysM repeat protein
MGGLVRVSRTPRRTGVVALVSLLAACASTPTGPDHVVKPGENLYRISRYYGVPVAEIRDANDIGDVRSLQVGQRLVIPDASKTAPSGALAAPRSPKPRAARAARRARRARCASPTSSSAGRSTVT